MNQEYLNEDLVKAQYLQTEILYNISIFRELEFKLTEELNTMVIYNSAWQFKYDGMIVYKKSMQTLIQVLEKNLKTLVAEMEKMPEDSHISEVITSVQKEFSLKFKAEIVKVFDMNSLN